MSIVCTKFKKQDGFILSPFIDNTASFYPLKGFKNNFKIGKIKKHMGIMTKIADDNSGRVYRNGKVDKTPSKQDRSKLLKGHTMAKEILLNCGVNPKSIFTTKPRGAHPGGSAAINSVVDKNLETLLPHLYVCDASVLPDSPGLPPLMTLLALSKHFVKSQVLL